MSIDKKITRFSGPNTTIRTKGKIIDAQYEISVCKTEVIGPDAQSSQTGIDGLMIRPGFTKFQWLNCQ